MPDDKTKRDPLLEGVLGNETTSEWVEHLLAMEDWDEHGGEPPRPTKPVSVRLDVAVIAMVDALAKRFRMKRSGLLEVLIQGGIADAVRQLSPADQQRIVEMVRKKCPDATRYFATRGGWDAGEQASEPSPRATSPDGSENDKGTENEEG